MCNFFEQSGISWKLKTDINNYLQLEKSLRRHATYVRSLEISLSTCANRISIIEIDPWIEIREKDRGKRGRIDKIDIFQGRDESGDAAIRDTRIARM